MEEKYLKYKLKYVQQKRMTGGAEVPKVPQSAFSYMKGFKDKAMSTAQNLFNAQNIVSTVQNFMSKSPAQIIDDYNNLDDKIKKSSDTLFHIRINKEDKDSATITAIRHNKIGKVTVSLKCISQTNFEIKIDNEIPTVKTLKELAALLLTKVNELSEKPSPPPLNFDLPQTTDDSSSGKLYITIHYLGTPWIDYEKNLKDILQNVSCP